MSGRSDAGFTLVVRFSRRLNRTQTGFTLIELVVAISIGMVVTLAAFGLLDSSIATSGRVGGRVDAAARARLAMDQIGRELRSQVCLTAGTGAITSAQDYAVTFYTFTGSGAYVPDKHTVSWDTNTNRLVDQTYAGAGAPPNTTFAAQPTQTNVLLTNVVPEYNVPIFTYYSYATAPVAPTQQLATPVAAASLPNIARVQIRFVARSGTRTDNTDSTTLETDDYARTWDPNNPSGPSPPPCG